MITNEILTLITFGFVIVLFLWIVVDVENVEEMPDKLAAGWEKAKGMSSKIYSKLTATLTGRQSQAQLEPTEHKADANSTSAQ